MATRGDALHDRGVLLAFVETLCAWCTPALGVPSPGVSPLRLACLGMTSRLRNSFAEVPRTLALVAKTSPRGTALLAVTTLACAVLPIMVAYAGKRIVDAVVAEHVDDAIRWVVVELVVVALLALATRGGGLLRGLLGSRLSVRVNTLILEKAITLDLAHFEDPEFYDRMTRARREASSRPIAVVTETFQLLQNALTLAGYVALIVHFSGWAVLGLVLAALPSTIAELRFSGEAFRLRNWRAPESRRLNYLEHVLATETHAKEVSLFDLGPLLLGRYESLGEKIYDEDKRLAIRRAAWAYVLSLLATGAFYACYGYLAIVAARGELTLGNLTLYVVAFRQGQQAFQSVLTAIGSMYEHNLYMSNLFAYLDASPREVIEGDAPRAVRDAPGITFEDVGFRYPGRDVWAMRHVSITIPPGQSLALVGQNGSGKTTFIKLLTRLYAPTEGRILLDGRDLRDWDEDVLRRRIGVVFQDFNRYQLPLAENVGVGSVDDMHDEARIARALERGGATELAAGLPKGIATPLGRQFKQEGVELSGGQWQKVALARAFMREQADILVLDEPTAALDAEAEQAVFERFRALTVGRTTILVSHRFPTVRTAERIVVLADGQIVESGDHASLLAADGRYAKWFKLQAAGYA